MKKSNVIKQFLPIIFLLLLLFLVPLFKDTLEYYCNSDDYDYDVTIPLVTPKVICEESILAAITNIFPGGKNINTILSSNDCVSKIKDLVHVLNEVIKMRNNVPDDANSQCEKMVLNEKKRDIATLIEQTLILKEKCALGHNDDITINRYIYNINDLEIRSHLSKFIIPNPVDLDKTTKLLEIEVKSSYCKNMTYDNATALDSPECCITGNLDLDLLSYDNVVKESGNISDDNLGQICGESII